MSAPARVLLPPRHDGTRPPVPYRWECDRGHLHPSRSAAVKCNIRHRPRKAS